MQCLLLDCASGLGLELHSPGFVADIIGTSVLFIILCCIADAIITQQMGPNHIAFYHQSMKR
jgi:UPF0716 family protein affecting phage T7 exclusion